MTWRALSISPYPQVLVHRAAQRLHALVARGEGPVVRLQLFDGVGTIHVIAPQVEIEKLNLTAVQHVSVSSA